MVLFHAAAEEQLLHYAATLALGLHRKALDNHTPWRAVSLIRYYFSVPRTTTLDCAFDLHFYCFSQPVFVLR